MRIAIIGAATALTLILPVTAQSLDCKNPADQNTLDTCIGLEYRAADKQLNTTFQALMAKLGKDGRAQLQKAQRAWIAYRDAQCDFDTAASVGGTIHPTAEAECLATLTKMQTQHLDQQLHCPEGDVSCGGP